jgi:hypothetical protein
MWREGEGKRAHGLNHLISGVPDADLHQVTERTFIQAGFAGSSLAGDYSGL